MALHILYLLFVSNPVKAGTKIETNQVRITLQCMPKNKDLDQFCHTTSVCTCQLPKNGLTILSSDKWLCDRQADGPTGWPQAYQRVFVINLPVKWTNIFLVIFNYLPEAPPVVEQVTDQLQLSIPALEGSLSEAGVQASSLFVQELLQRYIENKIGKLNGVLFLILFYSYFTFVE